MSRRKSELRPENDPLTPTLRLFLSVDIVGSTAFKQGQVLKAKGEDDAGSRAERWFWPLAQFYREIERLFTKEWDYFASDIAPEAKLEPGAAPELWKSVGDELLFVKVLTNHRQAYACIQAWIKAISSFRVSFKAKFPSLDLKTAAWVAGFPVHNAEVAFSRFPMEIKPITAEGDSLIANLQLLQLYYSQDKKKSAGIIRDFIGPAIDTGFRLAAHATPRKMVISVDLALLLSYVVTTKLDVFQFFYEGRIPLKGVLGGTPYPVFWINMKPKDNLEDTEDELTGQAPVVPEKMRKFCNEFIKSHPDHIFSPYIIGDTEGDFTIVPERHTDRLETLKAFWKGELEKRKIETASGLEKSAGGKKISSDFVDVVLSKKTGKDN